MRNAYDFDGTIYDGDSSIDFYFYCLKKKPFIIFFLPIQIYGIILYCLKIKNKDYMKEKIFSFLREIDDVDKYVNDFWEKNYNKIKSWYFNQKKTTDIIISASPEFLLKGLEKKLNIEKVIATKVNKKTGKFESKNCHDYEKIKRYEKLYGKKEINAFYSDSVKADRAMLEYSNKAYLVDKDEVKEIDIKNYKEENNFALLVSINILLFISILAFIPQILYLINISINKFYLPLTLLFLIIYNYFASKKSIKKTIKITLTSFIIIFASIAFCALITDISIDGNSYRKIMSGLLREGWNPVYESAQSFNKMAHILPDKLSSFGNKTQWFWMDVYPKGLATLGSCISIIFNLIETGKCYTILTMFVLFLLYYIVLKKYFNKATCILLSLIIALNPVSICQLKTFYVDAALSNIILIAVALSILYFRDNKNIYIYLICLCIMHSFSIKFNGILYIGITCIIMWLIQLIIDKKQNNYNKSKKIFILYSISILLSIVINYSPYITNITRYNEILPGITGESTKAIGNVTISTKKLNTIEIFYANIFSKVGDYWEEENLPLKVPFTFSKEEVVNYEIAAGQFGTFGMFFSGIYIVITILGLSMIIKYRKQIFKDKEGLITFIFVVSIYIQSVLSPIGYGGLRYVGHFYIIVPYVLALSMYFMKNTNNIARKSLLVINSFLVILIMANLIPYIRIYITNISCFRRDRNDLIYISNNYKTEMKVALRIETSHGMLLNLRDYNINYGDYDFVTQKELKGKVFNTCAYQIYYAHK